ncbi:MAG TPA: FAD-dependent oxidoreductase, partial [Thermomicrobiaceae bacterium]|nr:FAD-dependent oxidoreductase [Thermomicrobiaceae bacterium]
MSVVVIGAGAVGSSIAFRLAEGGARVTLIDRAEPAAGTSSRSFAWANSNQKLPRDYFELNYAGLRLHRALAQELGSAPWFHPGGNLIFATDSDGIDKLEQRVARLREWGYAAEWRKAADVRRRLEPDIAFPSDDLPVAYFPEEGWGDAPQLVRAMVELAQRHGATTIFGQAVTGIQQAGGQVSGVRLSNGRIIGCDAVVNAAGAAADRIARLLGLPLPLGPTPGLLVRVYAGVNPVSRLVHAPDVNIRPDGPGHLLLGHEDIDARLGKQREIDVAANDPLCRELFAR